MVVGIIDAVVVGVLAGIICEAAGADPVLRTILGALASITTAALLAYLGYRKVREVTRDYHPRFPS
ncbi:hypothetical protein AB0E63_26215 [Kribbella sp. NPDC026596]|uniref:hypothetical protein n=1 Tax=Kribbella sp. NPDC026596 TaxID=3155122 RepID=UPI0033D46701